MSRTETTSTIRLSRRYRERAAGYADLMLLGIASARNIVIDAGEQERAVQQFVSGNVFRRWACSRNSGGFSVRTTTRRRMDTRSSCSRMTTGSAGSAATPPSSIERCALTIVHTPSLVSSKEDSQARNRAWSPTFSSRPMMNAEALNANGWSWFRIWLRPREGLIAIRSRPS